LLKTPADAPEIRQALVRSFEQQWLTLSTEQKSTVLFSVVMVPHRFNSYVFLEVLASNESALVKLVSEHLPTVNKEDFALFSSHGKDHTMTHAVRRKIHVLFEEEGLKNFRPHREPTHFNKYYKDDIENADRFIAAWSKVEPFFFTSRFIRVKYSKKSMQTIAKGYALNYKDIPDDEVIFQRAIKPYVYEAIADSEIEFEAEKLEQLLKAACMHHLDKDRHYLSDFFRYCLSHNKVECSAMKCMVNVGKEVDGWYSKIV
jgi:hypothetical protein